MTLFSCSCAFIVHNVLFKILLPATVIFSISEVLVVHNVAPGVGLDRKAQLSSLTGQSDMWDESINCLCKIIGRVEQ